MSTTAKMEFCTKCDNLLYPMTGNAGELNWICRACKNVEDHAPPEGLVYAVQISGKESSDQKHLDELKMFAQDPTVPLTSDLTCPKCDRNKVAWFINPLEQPVEDMSLFFACVNTECQHVWKPDKRQIAQRPAA